MGVYIVTRETKSGLRYHVRWSNGRYVPVVHLGTYRDPQLAADRAKRANALLVLDQAPTRELLDQKKLREHGTFKSVAEAWLASEHKAASTMASRRTHVNAFIERWGRMQPRAITRHVVQAWIDESAGREVKPLMGSTITLYLSTLRPLLRKGADIDPSSWWGDLNVPEDDYVAPDLPDKARREGARALLRQGKGPRATQPLSESRRAFFDIIEHGGLRIEEVATLTWGQIDNEGDRLLRVGRKGIKKGGKKKPRIVARLAFQPDWIPQRPEGVADTDRVFPKESVTGKTFRDALYAACAEAGVERFRPHEHLRKLHATRLSAWKGIQHDLSLHEMALRMGHDDGDFLTTYSNHDMPKD